MKFNAVAVAMSAAMLAGAANAEDAEASPVAVDLAKFTVSYSPDTFLTCRT